MVIMEDPRVTANWLDMKEVFGANAKEDPKRAARQRARKDFIVEVYKVEQGNNGLSDELFQNIRCQTTHNHGSTSKHKDSVEKRHRPNSLAFKRLDRLKPRGLFLTADFSRGNVRC